MQRVLIIPLDVLHWIHFREPMEHIQHLARDVQIWGLVLVKVINLFHTTLQCDLIPGLLRKLSVSVVKHSMPVLLPAMQSAHLAIKM